MKKKDNQNILPGLMNYINDAVDYSSRFEFEDDRFYNYH